jgi:hypothetical protein
MITRQAYLDGFCSHREYYAQFVNDYIIAYVARQIGGQRLIESTNEHFNDIPLEEWDSLVLVDMIHSEKYLESFESLWVDDSTNPRKFGLPPFIFFVCVAKEAARQYVEQHIKETT